MLARLSLVVLISILLVSLYGCQQQPISTADTSKTYSLRDGKITVSSLASQLGLQVVEINGTHAKLKNSGNTVLIFTHTGGKFFVNGKEIGPVGEVARLDGTIYVPQVLVGQIRSVMKSGTTFEPSVPGKLGGKVVIDAGHGGKDPGAASVTGYKEKTVNLAIAQKTASKLKQRGITVIMTRQGDSFVELESRAAMANSHKADLFVSIHADSFPDRSRRGFTVYISEQASSGSQAAARAIAQRLSQVVSESQGIRRENYRVLVKTKMPAVLIEVGYLSNYAESNLIATSYYQDKLAQAISDGICDVIGRL